MHYLNFSKSIILLILLNFIVPQISYTQTGWYWQNPYPQGNELKAVQMDGFAGWAVGVLGTVMETTNQGNDWQYYGNSKRCNP